MNSFEETAPMHLFTSFSNVTYNIANSAVQVEKPDNMGFHQDIRGGGGGDPGFFDRGFKFIKGGSIC